MTVTMRVTKVKVKPKARRPARKVKPRLSRRSLLPVMRPQHNMRDIIKQLALVEDHHIHPTKRCGDCLKKHHCTLEALAEEAITLCKPRDAHVAEDAAKVAKTVRVMQHAWAQRPKCQRLNTAIARRLRMLRKCLMKKYATLPVDTLPSDEAKAVRELLASAKMLRVKRR